MPPVKINPTNPGMCTIWSNTPTNSLNWLSLKLQAMKMTLETYEILHNTTQIFLKDIIIKFLMETHYI